MDSKQASLESFCLEDRVKGEEKEDQDIKSVCVCVRVCEIQVNAFL